MHGEENRALCLTHMSILSFSPETRESTLQNSQSLAPAGAVEAARMDHVLPQDPPSWSHRLEKQAQGGKRVWTVSGRPAPWGQGRGQPWPKQGPHTTCFASVPSTHLCAHARLSPLPCGQCSVEEWGNQHTVQRLKSHFLICTVHWGRHSTRGPTALSMRGSAPKAGPRVAGTSPAKGSHL